MVQLKTEKNGKYRYELLGNTVSGSQVLTGSRETIGHEQKKYPFVPSDSNMVSKQELVIIYTDSMALWNIMATF